MYCNLQCVPPWLWKLVSIL